MTMGQFCTPHDDIVMNEFIPWLSEELNNAADDTETLALLAALSNVGHEAIIPTVLPFITTCEPSTEEEHNWYERARRSIKDESEFIKNKLRGKWLKYKKAKGKSAFPEKEEDEEYWGKSKWVKRDVKDQERLAEKRRLFKTNIQNKRIMAADINEQRREDKEFISPAWEAQGKGKRFGLKSQFPSLGANIREEVEDEEEEDLEGIDIGEFMRKLAHKRQSIEDLETFDLGMGEEEEGKEETDEATCNLIRTKAVFALSKLATIKSESVIPILMPIFFNKDEDTQVRLAALSLLMIQDLPVGFWSRVAVSTWFEPNDQVSSFIYTTLASLANNKDPKRREVITKAEAVIPMVKPIRWAPHLSYANVKGNYEERTRLGYLHKVINLGGYESFMPSVHYHNFRARIGPFRTKVLETAIFGKQIEKFIDQLIGKPTRRWKSAAGSYGGIGDIGQEANVGVASPELLEIHRELKIEARATGNPELYMYVNFLDNYQRFFHLDVNKFENLISNIVRNAALQGSGSTGTNYHRYTPLVDKVMRVPSAMGLAYGIFLRGKLFTNLKTKATGNLNLAGTTSVGGLLQSVVAAKFTSKMTVEAPFVRAIPTCGVDLSMKIALPITFRLAGDYKRGKLESSLAFLGDKVRVAHYGITPFITVRSIDDFTPAMLLKQTKLITLLDSVKQSKVSMGARATGLNFVYVERHDAKALKSPYAFTKDIMGLVNFAWVPSTLRMCEHELILDVANSDTKVIKTQLSIAAKHHSEVQKMSGVPHTFAKGVFGGLYGKTVKSGRFMDEESELDEWTKQKFSKVSESMENPHGFTMDISTEFLGEGGSVPGVRKSGMKMGTFDPEFSQKSSRIRWNLEPRLEEIEQYFKGPWAKAHRYGGTVAHAFDPQESRHRTHFMLEKQLEHDTEENFVLCFEGDMNWPTALSVKREKLITDEMATTGSFNLGFGKSCTGDRRISVKTHFSRSDAPEYPKTVGMKLTEAKCMRDELERKGVSEECLSTRKLAAILNKGIITINYNQMPLLLQNLTVKAENILRHWYGAYLSDNHVDVNNKENEIRIEAVYHPVIGTMDIRTYKPESNTFFHNIEVVPIAEAVVPFHARLSAYRAAFGGPGLCMVGEDAVTTFDGLNYNGTLSSCDTVITKDCSGRYKLAVLAREEGNKKVVTVLLNKEKIEISPVANRVRINNVERPLSGRKLEVSDDLNQIVAVIRQTPDNFIEVNSPTHWIRVTVNPKEVIVLGSAVHRGRMCGLCGNQNGDKTDDLLGPRKCSLPADLMDVAYELNRPSGCKAAGYSASPKEVSELRQVQEVCLKESMVPLSRSAGYQTKLGSLWKREVSYPFFESSPGSIYGRQPSYLESDISGIQRGSHLGSEWSGINRPSHIESGIFGGHNPSYVKSDVSGANPLFGKSDISDVQNPLYGKSGISGGHNPFYGKSHIGSIGNPEWERSRQHGFSSLPVSPFHKSTWIEDEYSLPHQRSVGAEYPEYQCCTIYKATEYKPPSYGYNKDYSYKQETYYTLYPEIVCKEVKKAVEYKDYGYSKPSYGYEAKSYEPAKY